MIYDHIITLGVDRLTARKAADICQRDGYKVTGVVLSLEDGRACIVNRSAVRWLSGSRDLWNLMFPNHNDSASDPECSELARQCAELQRQCAELEAAVAAEREACAQVCEAEACGGSAFNSAAKYMAERIRARGTP